MEKSYINVITPIIVEYNKSYADSVATNEFYFLDTSKNANKNRFIKSYSWTKCCWRR